MFLDTSYSEGPGGHLPKRLYAKNSCRGQQICHMKFTNPIWSLVIRLKQPFWGRKVLKDDCTPSPKLNRVKGKYVFQI